MRKSFSAVFVLAAALVVSGACSRNGSPTGPSNGSSQPPPPLPPPPVPPAAYEGREPFEGETVFVPIPFTSEFLEWQIIAAKPGMDGTYRRDDTVLMSARCEDKANLVKNLAVEGHVLIEFGSGKGTKGRFLSFIKFADFGQTTVCSKGWLEPQFSTGSNGGADPLLACCGQIREILFKFWINRSSAPTLTPTDLEYEQYTGWTRVN